MRSRPPGTTCIRRSTVRQALTRQSGIVPDVALIDIGLPGLDGYATAARIRRAIGRKPLLIALTGYGRPEDRERAVQAGFDLHLTKPVDPFYLLQLIHDCAATPAG